jgi:DNA-directed RNA polymerase specialized sigma subunit
MSDLKDIQLRELDLWKQWKAGDQAALPELMQSMKPIINQWTSRVSSAPLPKPYLEARVKKHLVDSLESYDPNKGAKLSTWANSRMKKVYRDIYPYQNVGSIPEHRITKIQSFESAKSLLEEKLNRDPTNLEISDELGWSLAEISRMQKELRGGTLSTEHSEEFIQAEDTLTADSLDYVYYSLDPTEKLVFEGLFGWGGKMKQKPGDIMKKMRLTPSEYRRIKQGIIRKIEQVI